MTSHHRTLGSSALMTIAALLLLAGVSCTPALATLIPTLVVPTVGVSPVLTSTSSPTPSFTSTFTPPSTFTETSTYTITPTFTRTPTITRTPTLTATPAPPVVTILEHSACLFGPGSGYLWKYGIGATAWMQVIGQIQDGSWLLIEEPYIPKKNPCWIKTSLVRFNDGGDVTTHNIPVVDPDIIMWYANNLYRPPTGVQAFRSGSAVTVFWNAVWMTEDDYRGYLIEAWVCHGGQLVFKPYFYNTSVNQNSGTLALKISDEPGCTQPSHARIYTVEKHGYTYYVKIPWPAFVPTSTLTP